MGIGAAVLGFMGATGGTLFGSAMAFSVAAGAITGAVVGAAVGGLTAAITGGDILQGVLFGAVGGAVLGGVSGYLGGASSMAASQAAPLNTAVTSPGGWESVVAEGGKVVGSTGGTTVSAAVESTGGMMSKIGGELAGGGNLTEILGKGAKEGIGMYMKNEAAIAEQEGAEKLMERKHQMELERMERAAELSGGGGGGGRDDSLGYAELAERKRQFDIQTKHQQKEYDTSQQMLAQRRGLFGAGTRQGGGSDPTGGESIQEKRSALALAGAEGVTPVTGVANQEEV